MRNIFKFLLVFLLITYTGVYADETGTGSNVGPVAVDDTFEIDLNETVEVNLVENDTDEDDDDLNVVSLGTILNGTGEITQDGEGVEFTPDEDFVGTISFEYTVSDGELTDTGSVSVNVVDENHAPVAVDDTFEIDLNETVEMNLVENDTDEDDDELSVVSLGTILNGTGEITQNGEGVEFTPDEDFVGTISFEYTVSDGELTDTGTVSVNVVDENHAPIAVDDTANMEKNETKQINLVENDTDEDDDDLSVVSLGTILNGEGEITQDGEGVEFTPDEDFVGTISFEYTVSDGELTDTGTVTVNVNDENHAPVVVDDTFEIDKDETVEINLIDNDTDEDDDDLSVVSLGTILNGEGEITQDGEGVEFTPDEDFVGTISFEYTVSDGELTDTGTVTVNVIDDCDDDDDDDCDDDDGNGKAKSVKEVQKEFIQKFKELKNEYKKLMGKREYRNEYLAKKRELRNEYLQKLKEVTQKVENDDDDEDEDDDDEFETQKKENKNKYKYEGDVLKNSYKNIYKEKYGKTISKLSDEKLLIIVSKIDNLIEEINDGNYSSASKEKANTMLLALRELVLENVEENVDDILDIDSLFE